MKVKFTKLAALLLAGAALFATGCTDYEVDIQKNADAIASANQQISALQTALNSLQSTHSTDVAALNKAISDLETSLKALIDKKADKEALEAAVARIKAIEDADFQAQIDALTAKDQEIEKTIADLKVLFADEIAKLDTRLKAAEAAIKEINEVTIPAIKEQIKALQAKDAQHDETLKLLSDYVKNLQDLTAGFPEGKTIKQYIDEQDSSLKDFLLKELEKYATKAELAEVEARLDARLKTLETLTAGFPEGTTIKKYIDDQVTAINNAIAELKALHEADVEELKAALKKVEDEVLSVKQAIRSLVFVPEVYVDGVEAILVSTLHYTPLELKDTNTVNENAVAAADTVINVTPPAIAKYHVVPSNADLTFLEVGDTVKFVVRENDPFIVTRAQATDDFEVIGIYQGRDTVETDCINVKVEVTGLPATDKNISVVALQLTKGEETYTSDYATVYSQDIDDVRIADPTNEEDDDAHYRRATEVISGTDNEAFLNNVVVWTDEFDTLSCDHQMAYDEPFDVQKYVIAHFIEGQECLPNEKTFEGLGFTWQFELVEDYDFCDNKLFTLTDKGVLTCKDGNAINNTPIVRVTIKDGDNNVQIAYVKVWVAPSDKEADIIWSKGDKGEVKDQFEFKCEGDTLIADSLVMVKEVLNLFPIKLENFNAAYPTLEDADPKVDTLGTVEFDKEKGVLSWFVPAEQLWPIASDPNLKEGQIPVIEHNVAFVADNGAKVVVKLVADVKPVKPYQITTDKYIVNYWDDELTYARYNVATPDLGETDSTLCVFHNNINAAFVTKKADGVIDLTGIGEEGLEVSDIKYYFCDDMEKITKVGEYTVKFTVEDGTGTRTDVNGTEFSVEGYNTILKAKIDTVEAEIAYICNDADEKDKTPNVVVLVKDEDPLHNAKKLLNTDEFYVLLGAKGMICGEEGFEVNLWWQSKPVTEPEGVWLDHFRANYIQPVKVTDRAADEFIDAVDFGQDGSFITLKDLIAPHDWRIDENYACGYREFGMNPGDQYYNYWEYYGVFDIQVDTANIKCNLTANKEVPVTVDLKVLTKEELKESVKEDAVLRDAAGNVVKDAEGNDILVRDYIEGIDDGGFGFLTYRNNGTAVKKFDLYVPVTVRYGWGVITTEAPITVPVQSTIG